MKVINHQTNMLMVTGLARSGTTLLAECLNHHSKVMCISDIMNELLKGFVRYAYYYVKNEKKNSNYPVDNFFFSGSDEVSNFIDQTDLKHKIPSYLRNEIISKTIQRDGGYNPEIISHVKKCKSESFDLLFLEIMQILHETYGNSDTEVFGIKTTWCEQLIKPLSNTFENMRFINILRDPRAVVASNYMSSESTRYPIIMSIRDWRKSVYYSWKFQNKYKSMSDKFISVQYENLVDNSEDILKEITKFIGIQYNISMINSTFKSPNTSYEGSSANGRISKRYKDRWKNVLINDFILQIEMYCSSEMEKLGYKKVNSKHKIDFFKLLSLKQIDYESVPSWCDEIIYNKQYYENTWLIYNSLLEITRKILLESPDKMEDENLINNFFYEKDYLSWLLSST